MMKLKDLLKSVGIVEKEIVQEDIDSWHESRLKGYNQCLKDLENIEVVLDEDLIYLTLCKYKGIEGHQYRPDGSVGKIIQNKGELKALAKAITTDCVKVRKG